MLGQRFVRKFTTICWSKNFNSQSHSFFVATAFAITQKRNNVRKSKELFLHLYPNEDFSTFAVVQLNKQEFKIKAEILDIDLTIYTLFDSRGYGKKVFFFAYFTNCSIISQSFLV